MYNQISTQLNHLNNNPYLNSNYYLNDNSYLNCNIKTAWTPVEKIKIINDKIKLINSNKYLKIINL